MKPDKFEQIAKRLIDKFIDLALSQRDGYRGTEVAAVADALKAEYERGLEDGFDNALKTRKTEYIEILEHFE